MCLRDKFGKNFKNLFYLQDHIHNPGNTPNFIDFISLVVRKRFQRNHSIRVEGSKVNLREPFSETLINQHFEVDAIWQVYRSL